MPAERCDFSGVPPRLLTVLAALLLFAGAARPQTAPYITDVVGMDGLENTAAGRGRPENGGLRLLSAFKLFNPDTVPFYLWVSFENGGKFKHSRSGDRSPAIRLVDLELRYKNALQRPMVKAFPKDGRFGRPPARRRSAWGSSSSSGSAAAGRFGKKRPHQAQSGGVEEASAADAAADRGGRGAGAVEIVFWREDVQGYYEMELWGVLYAPDVSGASVPGSYVENITFEVEVAR